MAVNVVVLRMECEVCVMCVTELVYQYTLYDLTTTCTVVVVNVVVLSMECEVCVMCITEKYMVYTT
jgi:hypothetical protein